LLFNLTTFIQIDYIISVNSVQISTFDPNSMRLVIDIEEKLTGDIWHGDFSTKYIEDITTKTGCYKKF